MTTIELFPADIYNQKTIRQGHPPDWTNRGGGEYDLVVLGGGPAGLVAATTAAVLHANYTFVSSGVVAMPDGVLGFKKGFLVRDPDGHVVQVIE